MSGAWKAGDRARYMNDEVVLTSAVADQWVSAQWVGDDGDTYGHLACHTDSLAPIDPETSAIEAIAAAAKAAGYAEGRAAERADVVQMLRDCHEYGFEQLATTIANGAHVGAAKKEQP